MDSALFLFYIIVFHFPENEFAWKDDEEFGRQMLAGINPARIRSLEVCPTFLSWMPEQAQGS